MPYFRPFLPCVLHKILRNLSGWTNARRDNSKTQCFRDIHCGVICDLWGILGPGIQLWYQFCNTTQFWSLNSIWRRWPSWNLYYQQFGLQCFGTYGLWGILGRIFATEKGSFERLSLFHRTHEKLSARQNVISYPQNKTDQTNLLFYEEADHKQTTCWWTATKEWHINHHKKPT